MSLIVGRDKLTTRSPFKDLFPIDKDVLTAITESVTDRFDSERPIIAWKKNDRELIVVDGHTRLEAARKARLKQVPVVLRKFPDERTALEYAIAEQRNRRNMSPEEQARYVLRVVEALDEKVQGARTDLATSGQAGTKLGAEQTAELVGTSVRTVKRARRVRDSGDEQVKQQVREGKLSLPAAERKLSDKRSDHCSDCSKLHPDGDKLARGWARVSERTLFCPDCFSKKPRVAWDRNDGDGDQLLRIDTILMEDVWKRADRAREDLIFLEDEGRNPDPSTARVDVIRDELIDAINALSALMEAARAVQHEEEN